MTTSEQPVADFDKEIGNVASTMLSRSSFHSYTKSWSANREFLSGYWNIPQACAMPIGDEQTVLQDVRVGILAITNRLPCLLGCPCHSIRRNVFLAEVTAGALRSSIMGICSIHNRLLR